MATAIGLTAVVVAVTDEVPRILVVHRLDHPLAAPLLAEMGGPLAERPEALPSGPFEPDVHRTLESGLRAWVEEQTGLPLRYVEQLYTLGDRYRDPRELEGGPRLVSVAYIALVQEAPLTGSGDAEWRDWYGLFPWEDWRYGRPDLVDRVILPRLRRWCETADAAALVARRGERVSTTFGDGAPWDPERTLERFELLYEAGLVVEAPRDRVMRAVALGETPPAVSDVVAAARAMGVAMAFDDRRILATALGRLRGKLRYRPVVFDLLSTTFTLLQLQRVVEALGGVLLHKQNFRRLVLNGGLVEATGERQSQTRGRPAELFRFRRGVLRERPAAGIGLPTILAD